METITSSLIPRVKRSYSSDRPALIRKAASVCWLVQSLVDIVSTNSEDTRGVVQLSERFNTCSGTSREPILHPGYNVAGRGHQESRSIHEAPGLGDSKLGKTLINENMHFWRRPRPSSHSMILESTHLSRFSKPFLVTEELVLIVRMAKEGGFRTSETGPRSVRSRDRAKISLPVRTWISGGGTESRRSPDFR